MVKYFASLPCVPHTVFLSLCRCLTERLRFVEGNVTASPVPGKAHPTPAPVVVRIEEKKSAGAWVVPRRVPAARCIVYCVCIVCVAVV